MTNKEFIAMVDKYNELVGVQEDEFTIIDIYEDGHADAYLGLKYYGKDDAGVVELDAETMVEYAKDELAQYYDEDFSAYEFRYTDPKFFRSQTAKWRRFINKYSK